MSFFEVYLVCLYFREQLVMSLADITVSTVFSRNINDYQTDRLEHVPTCSQSNITIFFTSKFYNSSFGELFLESSIPFVLC